MGVFGDTADNKVWHSPLVFSGTCTDVDPNKKCSKISIWYVYKGEELLTEKVISKNLKKFEKNFTGKLDLVTCR